MKPATALLACAIALLGAAPENHPKAREILDEAALAAPGAKPEVAATAMRRIGENYDAFSKPKAIGYLKRAFDLSLGIPPAENLGRERIQAAIAGTLAVHNLPDAIEMLKRSTAASGPNDPRTSAIDKIVSLLTGKKQFDEAIDLVTTLGATGQYPYAAARQIFEKLPKNDLRRPMVFGNAMTAYPARPSLEFGEFLAAVWSELPARTAEASLRSVVETVLAMKDDGLTESFGTTKGALVLANRQEVELFDLLPLLLKVDPKKAEEILAQKPNLRAAITRFPNGRASTGQFVTSSRGYQDTTAQAATSAAYMQVIEQIDKVINGLGDTVTEAEVDRIMNLATGIPVPETRAALLSELAQATTDDQPEIAKMVLAKSLDLLKDSKDPNLRLEAWKEVARLAFGLHDTEAAWNALNQMADAALALYKLDTDVDNPNTGLTDDWPSTNAWRNTIITAAELLGANAETLVLRIPDPDIALLIRIELAQKLLGRPHEVWVTSLRTPKK